MTSPGKVQDPQAHDLWHGLSADDDFEGKVAVKVADLRNSDGIGVDTKRTALIKREVHIMNRLLAFASSSSTSMSLAEAMGHLVGFHGHYVEGGLAYLILELCSSSLLSALEAMPRLTEGTLIPIFQDMLSGITACHAAGIAHRDVKPDNFLAIAHSRGRGCSEDSVSFSVKLCDFGLAGELENCGDAEGLSGVYGTPPYMAPEMLAAQDYGAKVDVWAFGAMCYVLLLGRWPYSPAERSGSAMKTAIRSGVPEPCFQSKDRIPISKSTEDLLRSLLRRDPRERVSAAVALASPALSVDTSFAAGANFPDSQRSLRPTLSLARRLGAFDGHGSIPRSTELDRRLHRLNSMRDQACGGPSIDRRRRRSEPAAGLPSSCSARTLSSASTMDVAGLDWPPSSSSSSAA